MIRTRRVLAGLLFAVLGVWKILAPAPRPRPAAALAAAPVPAAAPPPTRPGPGRIVLGLVGVATALFGAWGILTHQQNSPPMKILPWWIAVVVIHDGVVAPLTVLAGWSVRRWLPRGTRAPVQFAGIVCALVTLFAVPLLWRQGHGFEGSTLLTRDYRANLTGILVAVIVVTALVSLARGLRRSRRRHAR